MPGIQSYQVQGTVHAIDRDSKSRSYVTGGRQCINVFELNTDQQYWFKSKWLTRRALRNSQQTKPNVFDLSWNKAGSQNLAVGSTCGFVYVFDLSSDKTNPFFAEKGSESSIKRIVWQPNSVNTFYSLYHQSCIIRYDTRQKKQAGKFDYQTTIKFRDLKFNPFDPNVMAVGEFSDQIQLFDARRMNESFLVECRGVSDQMGSIVDWDPFCKNRLASAGNKSINFWTWSGSELIKDGQLSYYNKGRLTQEKLVDHFLIKSFRFLQKKKNCYGISEQYIYFYNLKNTDFAERIYGGNSKNVDCWITDQSQNIIISASQPKSKANMIKTTTRMTNNPMNPNTSVIVAQYQDNYLCANQQRQNHPIAFDSDNSLAFPWKGKGKYTVFSYEGLLYQPHGVQKRSKLTGLSIKEQLEYLDAHYVRKGKEQFIAETNSKIALQLGKKLCSQMWINIFHLAFPKQTEPHTITSLFQEESINETQIINNCLMAKKKMDRDVGKFDICSFLQEIVDQGELQTAVIAALCLNMKAKQYRIQQPVVPTEFMKKIIHPYVQILSSLQMYVIATHTFLETELDTFKNVLKESTKFSISCGICKANLSKSQTHKDICSATCLECRKTLDDRMVICCIYCGHGGHADEFRDRVINRQTKCLSCSHQCFTRQQHLVERTSQSLFPFEQPSHYDLHI